MSAPQDARQVHEHWPIYDTVRISTVADAENYPGGFADMIAVAAADNLSFFNIRQASAVGNQYTNIQSKDKIPWPYWLDSIGLRFVCPDPISNITVYGQMLYAKFFQELAWHSWVDLYISEDIKLTLCSCMMTPGYGVSGYGAGANAAGVPQASSALEQGEGTLGNRFKWTGNKPVRIPVDTPYHAELNFSPYGKYLLAELGAGNWMPAVNFGDDEVPTTFDIEILIEMTLFGTRAVQQRGELFAS